MSVNVLYTTQATAIGGRDGRATTKDGILDVKLTSRRYLIQSGQRLGDSSVNIRSRVRAGNPLRTPPFRQQHISEIELLVPSACSGSEANTTFGRELKIMHQIARST